MPCWLSRWSSSIKPLRFLTSPRGRWKWGPDQRSFPFPVSNIEAYNFHGLIISKINFWTILISLVLMFILFLFFRYTKLGIAMRATQQNQLAARVMGIRTKWILSFTWAISSMAGAVAGE